jgi:hypothetical protein
MTTKIPRPGSLGSTEKPDDTLKVPLTVMEDSLLTGYFSWAVGIESTAAEFAAAGTLGAFETVALVGSGLGLAGAGVLFVLGAMALFRPERRADLVEANKTIGVITSLPGLLAMAGMEAAGYSTKEATRVGEYAKNVFAGYALYRETGKGLETFREQASAAKEFREIRDFIHERFAETGSDEGEPAAGADWGPSRDSDDWEKVRLMVDREGQIHFAIVRNVRDVTDKGDEADGGDSIRDGMGPKPGPGEIGHPGDGDGHGGGDGEDGEDGEGGDDGED